MNTDSRVWVVRTFDNKALYSNGVTSDTDFGDDKEAAELYLEEVQARLKPGQSASLLYWEY